MKKKRSEFQNKLTSTSKKEIGRRFYEFRKSIDKTQNQLAKELTVYQSTITNLEVGKTFPSIHYILYFHEKYGLNPTWLLSGIGDKFLKEDRLEPWVKSVIPCHLEESDPDHDKYVQLLELMRIPKVESIIMGKVAELLMYAKEEIEAYRKELKDNIESEEE